MKIQDIKKAEELADELSYAQLFRDNSYRAQDHKFFLDYTVVVDDTEHDQKHLHRVVIPKIKVLMLLDELIEELKDSLRKLGVVFPDDSEFL